MPAARSESSRLFSVVATSSAVAEAGVATFVTADPAETGPVAPVAPVGPTGPGIGQQGGMQQLGEHSGEH